MMPASIELSNYYFHQISSFCCIDVLMHYAVLIAGDPFSARWPRSKYWRHTNKKTACELLPWQSLPEEPTSYWKFAIWHGRGGNCASSGRHRTKNVWSSEASLVLNQTRTGYCAVTGQISDVSRPNYVISE